MVKTIVIVLVCILVIGGISAWSFWFGNAGSNETDEELRQKDSLKERKG